METILERSSLGALHLANSNTIQANCLFKIAEARTENTWAVYSIGTINTNVVCPATNVITLMQIQSVDTVRIKPECNIRNESETIEIRIKAMNWAMEITDLFHRGNKETIHQSVQGLSTRYNAKFDATILWDQLDYLQTPDPHWTFTSPAAIIRDAIYTFALHLENLENLLPI